MGWVSITLTELVVRARTARCRVKDGPWVWICIVGMWREVADIVVLRCGKRGRGGVGLVVVTVCVRSSAYQFS